MTRIFSRFAAACLLSALSVSGIAHADSMKADTMKKDTMHTDMSKTSDMKMKAMPMMNKKDCMHKAGMEMNKMKQADMMKACETMK